MDPYNAGKQVGELVGTLVGETIFALVFGTLMVGTVSLVRTRSIKKAKRTMFSRVTLFVAGGFLLLSLVSMFQR